MSLFLYLCTKCTVKLSWIRGCWHPKAFVSQFQVEQKKKFSPYLTLLRWAKAFTVSLEVQYTWASCRRSSRKHFIDCASLCEHVCMCACGTVVWLRVSALLGAQCLKFTFCCYFFDTSRGRLFSLPKSLRRQSTLCGPCLWQQPHYWLSCLVFDCIGEPAAKLLWTTANGRLLFAT